MIINNNYKPLISFITITILLMMSPLRIADADSGGWEELPNTTLNAQCPEDGFNDATFGTLGGLPLIYDFSFFCVNVTAAWSGASFDATRNRLYIWGGGHMNYLGNEIYALDLNSTPSMIRLTDPATPLDYDTDPSELPPFDGTQPRSRETYDGMVYLPGPDKLWAWSGSLATSGFADGVTWLYDPTLNTWQRQFPSGSIPYENIGAISAYDPNTGAVYLHNLQNLYRYTYNTSGGTYTQLTMFEPGYYVHMNGVIDPKRNKFILIGRGANGEGQSVMYDIGSGSNFQSQAINAIGDTQFLGTEAPGLAYDPVIEKVVAWAGGDTVYILDIDANPPTWTAESYPVQPPQATQAPVAHVQGTYGRFAYAPAMKAFVLYNATSTNGYLFRWKDTDNDGIIDKIDNCPLVANTNQNDTDEDEFGDVCDDDLENSAPTVSVISPNTGDNFNTGDSISFNGASSDAEDGNLTVSLRWSSSLDGVIGNGGSFSTSFLSEGTHTITATTTDSGGLPGFDSVTITIFASGGQTTLLIPISAGLDDVEEKQAPNDRVIIGSTDLDFVRSGGNQTVGLRFNGLNIPQGTLITNAYIQFTANATRSESTSLTIEGEDSDNAVVFSRANGNVSSRPRTISSVAWLPAPWTTVGEAGNDQRTSDLSSIVQEIVNRSGWTSNNSLAFIISGNGKRDARSFEGNQADAPVLHIEYDDAGNGSNTAPTVSIISPVAGEKFNVGDSISFNGASNDAEDVDLTASLSWSSNLDGVIGNGGSFSTSFLSEGTHTITATTADSDGLSDSDSITITILALGGQTTLSIPISAGLDDVEEKAAPNNRVILGSIDLDFVRSGGNQTVGLRFNGLSIPQGAIITNAYIQFTANATRSETTSLAIEGEAVDNAMVFARANDNVSSRPRTTSSVAWLPAPWTTVGDAGNDQRTADLSSIVQEIVNRPGWTSDNSLAFIITGTGKRDARSFEANQADAPVLHVTFQ